MNEVFLVYIMIGANHLAPILGRMISSMQIICSRRLRKGTNNYFSIHNQQTLGYLFSLKVYATQDLLIMLIGHTGAV